MLIDGDAAFTGGWKYPGSLSEQPAYDVDIWRIVRAEWARLRNDQMKRDSVKQRSRAGAIRGGR